MYESEEAVTEPISERLYKYLIKKKVDVEMFNFLDIC
jgi:hypothetical protein